MTRKIDPSLIPPKPNLDFERCLWNVGIQLIGGIDEAGRGCLAGPVFAAVVVLPLVDKFPRELSSVRDSKALSSQDREQARKSIQAYCRTWAVGSASNQEIDQLGIMPATHLAVSKAIKKLDLELEHLLVDYIVLPDQPIPQTRLVKGDARSLSIAAASILAKTHRDEFMLKAADHYPGYGFETNKGYGTAQHRQAIINLGPCPLHRTSFAPLNNHDLETSF
jgi:ribonuclease HII